MKNSIDKAILTQINFWNSFLWRLKRKTYFSKCRFFERDFEEGLDFLVSGPEFKGNIFIGLTANNTYTPHSAGQKLKAQS